MSAVSTPRSKSRGCAAPRPDEESAGFALANAFGAAAPRGRGKKGTSSCPRRRAFLSPRRKPGSSVFEAQRPWMPAYAGMTVQGDDRPLASLLFPLGRALLFRRARRFLLGFLLPVL